VSTKTFPTYIAYYVSQKYIIKINLYGLTSRDCRVTQSYFVVFLYSLVYIVPKYNVEVQSIWVRNQGF
jgi:hypothetical protein